MNIIEHIKEIIFFQILNRCPVCNNKELDYRYRGGWLGQTYYCPKCHWGEW